MTLPWNRDTAWVSADLWTADSGGGGGGTVTPDDITGLILRWRADSIDQADSSAVASWPALTGGVALAQATGTAQPSYLTNVLNGQPVVRFDGSSDYLTASLGAHAQPLTLSFVFKANAIPAGDWVQLLDAGTSVQIIWGNTNLIDCYAGVDLMTSDVITTTGYHVLTFVLNSTSSLVYWDGMQAGSGNSGTNTMSAVPTAVGRQAGSAGRFASMDLAEIVIYSRALTPGVAGDLGALDTYFSQQYGLTLADASAGEAWAASVTDTAGIGDATIHAQGAGTSVSVTDSTGVQDSETHIGGAGNDVEKTATDGSGVTDTIAVQRTTPAEPERPSGLLITIYDGDYTRQGRVGDYISAEFTWAYLAAGTGTLVVQSDHWFVAQALTCYQSVVPVVVDAQGYRWSGRVASVAQKGGDTAAVTLVDEWPWLQSLLAWPVPGNVITQQTVAFYELEGPLATTTAQIINDNAIRLGVPVIAIIDSPDTSPTRLLKARMQPVADYVASALRADGWKLTATIWLPGDDQPTGVVPHTGDLTAAVNTLTVPTVVMKIEECEAKPWLRWTESIGGISDDRVTADAPTAYRLVLGGDGQDEARIFAEYVNTARQTSLGTYGFPEAFSSQSGDATELAAAGPGADVDYAGKSSISVTVQDATPWHYGLHYLVGDVPTLILPGLTLTDQPITSVTVSDKADSGFSFRPTIGESKEMDAVSMVASALAQVVREIRRLEARN